MEADRPASPMTDLPFLDTIFLGNTARAWLVALVVALVAYALLVGVRRVVVARLRDFSARTDTDLDDGVVHVLRRTSMLFFAAVAVVIATRGLVLPDRTDLYLKGVVKAIVLMQVALWGAGVISFLTERSLARRQEGNDRIGVAAIRAFGVGAKVIVWLLVFLTGLRVVFGFDVTVLLTGLGVGGIALALAVQNILGDLLAALAIVLDKPFDVGDFVVVDQIKGTVEHIGLKTTRLRSLSGEQIVLSNSDLLKSRLHNYKRMVERRAVFTVDLTYDTPPDVVERVPAMIREIVEAQAPVRFDRSHFLLFADSSLRVETVYWVLAPEYNTYADIQQRINVAILRRFNADGISFAFPTRTVHVEGGLAPAAG
jgi:small-conductance mechanosensitive channel